MRQTHHSLLLLGTLFVFLNGCASSPEDSVIGSGGANSSSEAASSGSASSGGAPGIGGANNVGAAPSGGTQAGGSQNLGGSGGSPSSGGSGASGGQEGSGGAEDMGPMGFEAVRFVADQICGNSLCHAEEAPPELQDNALLYNTLMTHEVTSCDNMLLVVASKPDESAFLKIITEGCGDIPRMPQDCEVTNSCLAPELIRRIEQWIVDGAVE